MIGSELKRELLEGIAPLPAPMLSLYLDVAPANSAGKAFVLHAAQALKALNLDKGYVGRVTERLRQEFVRLKGRSLVIFAGEDPDRTFDAFYLQARLPLMAADGAQAFWGKPLVAPLLFALDQKTRYAAIYVAADHVRVFEVFLGQIEDVAGYVRSVSTDDWVEYSHGRTSHGIGVMGRGGADVDTFQARLENASARLYRTLLPGLERKLEAEKVDGVILLGEEGPVKVFEDAMSSPMRAKVAGKLPGPANPAAAAHEWLPLVSGLIATDSAAHARALLDRIEETGVWGAQETLELLQAGRLHTVVVPWSGSGTVYQTSGGVVSAMEPEAIDLAADETVAAVTLLQVLPDLVQRTGTILAFAEGEAEKRLIDDFGGMAGLRRW